MHRKTTSRRENKRIDSKKVRAAENAALRGDNLRLVRTGGWAGRDDRQPPVLDSARTGKKKKGKKIEYCPARRHEGSKKRHYYIEREVTETYPLWWNEGMLFTETRKEKVCMYCRKNGNPRRRRWKF